MVAAESIDPPEEELLTASLPLPSLKPDAEEAARRAGRARRAREVREDSRRTRGDGVDRRRRQADPASRRRRARQMWTPGRKATLRRLERSTPAAAPARLWNARSLASRGYRWQGETKARTSPEARKMSHFTDGSSSRPHAASVHSNLQRLLNERIIFLGTPVDDQIEPDRGAAAAPRVRGPKRTSR